MGRLRRVRTTADRSTSNDDRDTDERRKAQDSVRSGRCLPWRLRESAAKPTGGSLSARRPRHRPVSSGNKKQARRANTTCAPTEQRCATFRPSPLLLLMASGWVVESANRPAPFVKQTAVIANIDPSKRTISIARNL
uniref:Uncharacterized protein n=1 Tax=Plectus sambesii TaxID=2011161 RepID=A0A914UVQ0_9BILA